MDTCDAIHQYFDLLLKLRSDQQLDTKGIMKLCRMYAFHTIEKEYKLIENNTQMVYIPNGENTKEIEMIRKGQANRSLLRRLSQDTVNIYEKYYE